ncbi:MAG: hypothetical protein ACLQGU_09665 [bacterium]
MINEPIVPLKKSIRSALTIIVLFLLTLATLSACVNIRTVKIPEEYNKVENKVAVVPIETVCKDAYLNRMNIEILLNEISKAPDLNELKLGVLGNLINWHPELALSEKISEELTRRGRPVIQVSEIVPLPENIRHSSSAGPKWYNPDVSMFDHSEIKNLYNPTVIMEVSFESVTVFGNATLTGILIRGVNPQNNRVIARIRTIQTLRRGKYDFRDPIQRQQYVVNFRAEFESELSKEIPRILDKMGF